MEVVTSASFVGSAHPHCPVCQAGHERNLSDTDWVGPHVCPAAKIGDRHPWCSTCQVGCARKGLGP